MVWSNYSLQYKNNVKKKELDMLSLEKREKKWINVRRKHPKSHTHFALLFGEIKKNNLTLYLYMRDTVSCY